MNISDELKKHISYGDYSLIADMYAERHRQGNDPDYKTVSSKYVEMVINEVRPANPETAAEEIMMIAQYYLTHKANFRDQILAV